MTSSLSSSSAFYLSHSYLVTSSIGLIGLASQSALWSISCISFISVLQPATKLYKFELILGFLTAETFSVSKTPFFLWEETRFARSSDKARLIVPTKVGFCNSFTTASSSQFPRPKTDSSYSTVSLGLVTVCPIVRESIKISWSLPPS